MQPNLQEEQREVKILYTDQKSLIDLLSIYITA